MIRSEDPNLEFEYLSVHVSMGGDGRKTGFISEFDNFRVSFNRTPC